jgi:hypothetical protein
MQLEYEIEVLSSLTEKRKRLRGRLPIRTVCRSCGRVSRLCIALRSTTKMSHALLKRPLQRYLISVLLLQLPATCHR